MGRAERAIYLVVCLALATLSLFLQFRTAQATRTAATTEATLQVALSKAQAHVEELTAANRELQGQLTLARVKAGTSSGEPLLLLTDTEMADLVQLGLPDPIGAIREALQLRTDLLPEPGAAFAPPDQWAISRHWIIARFKGGRGDEGIALFRFAIAEGEITITRIDPLHPS